MIDPTLPRDAEPARKGDMRKNWRAIVDALHGAIGIRPLLHGYAEVLGRPAIIEGVAQIDLDQARAHAITLTEDLVELRLKGAVPSGRLVTVTIRLLQTDPAKSVPALDRFVWVKERPRLPEPGRALWLSAITIDGGSTWEAFG